MRNHPDQIDFLETPVFATRRPERFDAGAFRSRMKRGMAAALRGHDRAFVAAEMSRQLGAACSKAMLDAYTSEAKTHDISLIRFKALVRAADAPGLWDMAISDEGLIVLAGDEARLAEIGRLQQEQREIGKRLAALKSIPVNLTGRG